MHISILLVYREANELEVWISEKEAVASSEDTGRDLEHVEVRMYICKCSLIDMSCNHSPLIFVIYLYYPLFVIQLLQKKFEDFKADLNRSKDRVSLLNAMSQELLTAGHSASVEINNQLRLTNMQWETLQNKTLTRDKILAAAKELHVFNRDASEAKTRILVNYV